MKHKKFGEYYCIKLEKGDKIIESLTEMCNKENIKFGFFNGIGAVGEVNLGIYNIATKKYFDKIIKKPLEVISLSGNVAQVEDEGFVHAHVVLSDEDMRAFGGHLKEATVSVTAEIILRKIDGEIKRKEDMETGLNLWDL